MSLPLICVAGKNDIAVSALRHFLSHYPDHPVCFIPNANDQGVDGWQPSLTRHATAWGIRKATLEELYDVPDLRFFSLEFDRLIRVHRFSSRFLFNFHFSKLPKYRGVYTAALPILHGETQSGVTLHLMDDGIDTGEIIDALDVSIGADDTARDLYFNNMAAAKSLFLKTVDRLVAGDFTTHPQPVQNASYFSLNSIDYGAIRLDFKKTAFEIHNQVRAFTFREFQLPHWNGWSIGRSEITDQRSTLRAGRLVDETDAWFRIASIDYDVLLFKDYQSHLLSSCERGDLPAVEAALAHVADVDLRNREGWNALIIAVYHGRVDIIRHLLAVGANPDATNYKGTNVLMYALSRYEQTQELLGFELIAKAARRPEAADQTGRTVRDWILEKGLMGLLAPLAN